MKTTTFIYGLYCPLDEQIKYIGKSNDPKGRYRKHLQMCDNNNQKNEWISKLINSGLKPILKILEEVNIEDWKNKEKEYIKNYGSNNLYNICGGANGLTFGNQTSFKGKPFVKVVCLDKNGNHIKTFESIKEATIFNGKKIFNVLVGKRKSSGGYFWLYESKYKLMDDKMLLDFVIEHNINRSSQSGKKTQFKKGQKPHNCKKVAQYTKDGEYIKTWNDSAEPSMFYTGKRSSGINNCALGKCKTSLGYIWKYIE